MPGPSWCQSRPSERAWGATALKAARSPVTDGKHPVQFLDFSWIPARDRREHAPLTDGVTEAENEQGEFFERDRTLNLVAELRGQPSRRIVSGLYKAIESFRSPGPRADDVTAVVGKALPTG